MSNPMPMVALRNSFAVERNKVAKQDSTGTVLFILVMHRAFVGEPVLPDQIS
jgi:hypothetical protein